MCRSMGISFQAEIHSPSHGDKIVSPIYTNPCYHCNIMWNLRIMIIFLFGFGVAFFFVTAFGKDERRRCSLTISNKFFAKSPADTSKNCSEAHKIRYEKDITTCWASSSDWLASPLLLDITISSTTSGLSRISTVTYLILQNNNIPQFYSQNCSEVVLILVLFWQLNLWNQHLKEF